MNTVGHANDRLYRAVRIYVPLAIDLIVQRATVQVDVLDITEEHIFFASLDADDNLLELPEYRACVDAILADNKINSQLNTLVGDNSWRERSLTLPWLMRRLPQMGLARGRYAFDKDYFEREYEIFETTFYDDYITYDVIAPLQNILVTGTVKLGEDLEISLLTDDDLDPRRTSSSKVIQHEPGLEGSRCAVRSKFRVRKLIGEQPSVTIEEAEKDRERLTQTAEQIDEVINAIRLFGAETVYYTSIIYRTSEWLFSDEKVLPTRMRAPVPLIYQNNQLWLQAFGQFWRKFRKSISERKFIAVATRRFGYAIERPFTEDRLVDFMIAAESLFLNDIEDKKYQGELQYRLSMRCACLLGSDLSSRSAVRAYMQQAYNIRSLVVHGSMKTIKPRDENRNPIPLEQFLGTIQMYMHRALRLMIDQAASVRPKEPLFDWERVMLGGENLIISDKTTSADAPRDNANSPVSTDVAR
ncbi:MAG: hypothetical protein H0V18_03150 [Pyrinomonadaceae bacterium]|nr:hypothetical protein [Pyrinomonadaceae bacterium]